MTRRPHLPVVLLLGALAAGTLISFPAEARGKKRRAAPAHTRPSEPRKPSRSLADQEAAEAQLAELRSMRELPTATLSGQDDDRESPFRRGR